MFTSFAVDSSGDVHISYFNSHLQDLKYATYDGSSWTTSTVDSVGFVGVWTSLAVDSSGDVHISHCDWTNYDLKYATLSGGNSSGSANEITVQFGDYGNVTGTVVDDSTINVTSPQGPSSGEVVDITLWDWNDTGYVLNSAFTYFNPDIDGDGVQNALDDCPEVAGNSTIDQFGCPDSDGDGYSDSGDSFPSDSSEWGDGDGDGVGDNGDAFPNDANESADSDGDGVGDNSDAFPSDANESADSDGDGIGDNADEYPELNNFKDSDGDSFFDIEDAFPNDSSQWSDYDGDGWGDNPFGNKADAFPNDSTQWEDSDGDGFGDNWGDSPWNETRLFVWPGQFVEGAEFPDHCPTQYGNSSADGFYGCPDDDGDGIANIYDNLTDEENETAPVDTDLDGVFDSEDMCPDTIVNGIVDATGCLLDSDGDGIDDLQDKCANTKIGVIINVDGCEIVEEPEEESESYFNSLLAGESETILKTVGFGAILIAFLGFLQTNIAAALLPDAFRWVQVLRKKSKLSAEEEQELVYLQSLVQAYYYEPENMIEELYQLKTDLTARFTNNEIKKTTREKMNTLIVDLLMMDESELKRVANNEAYFGLAGTIDTNQRSELLSEELAMKSDTLEPEFGFEIDSGGPELLQSTPSNEIQGEINPADNYEYLEHPSGSGTWYFRNSGTGEWDEYHS